MTEQQSIASAYELHLSKLEAIENAGVRQNLKLVTLNGRPFGCTTLVCELRSDDPV
jgi:hypothetical protein